jgi:hypothetical protein
MIRQVTALCRDTDTPLVDWLLPWRRLLQHLSPLIGDSGFSALHGRALRLRGADYPWLGMPPPALHSATLLEAMQKDLDQQAPDIAHAANEALLATFTELLSGLIGEALTIRLLAAAWNAGPPADAAKEQR